MRKCIGCNQLKPRSEMIKVTRVHNTREILINPNSTYFGRSSYICYNNECIQNAIKKKRLQKTLRTEIPQQIIEKINDNGKSKNI